MSEEKACVFCGAVYRKREDESLMNWRKRRYCSRSCAARVLRPRAPEPAPGHCLGCGASFERGENESRSRFAERKYCGQRCAGIAMHAALKASRESGPELAEKESRRRFYGVRWPENSPRFEDSPAALAEKGSLGLARPATSFVPAQSSAA